MVKLIQSEWTAFEGTRRVASGDLALVIEESKRVVERGPRGPVLLFDNRTGSQTEVDFSEDADRILARLAASDEPAAPEPEESAPRRPGRPGRPKLGVVGREVTLLPRHWEWLNAQPGGASVALRRLVDAARKTSETQDAARHAKERAYRFISAMAGNEANFEEANRALFAADGERFRAMTEQWPIDVRDHALALAEAAF